MNFINSSLNFYKQKYKNLRKESDEARKEIKEKINELKK